MLNFSIDLRHIKDKYKNQNVTSNISLSLWFHLEFLLFRITRNAILSSHLSQAVLVLLLLHNSLTVFLHHSKCHLVFSHVRSNFIVNYSLCLFVCLYSIICLFAIVTSLEMPFCLLTCQK